MSDDPQKRFYDALTASGFRTGSLVAQLTPGPMALAAASFATSAVWGGLVALVLSQVVYAGFAALFQALGPVLLGRWLPSGLAGGVGVFGAVLQVGALVGVLVPLLVPGYGAAVFWVATLPCVVAGTLLAALGQARAPATADAPLGGSPTSATGRGT